ncbi:protein male-specific lethal-3 isoform X2 [Scaptodrosophila lebanonensis]|uniref:Protein male-specific lethal-3 n=1 Tax=Drosophila lebanonensis TaxID=7225 RepID=A0A6J2UD58_DROLE|nr:protein male-specific lethal-3 isoform X2 [Scaptodrosophila lebanonensis]
MTAKENEGPVFVKGEKVLCYEPDSKKASVLYECKVLCVYERKDKQGNKYYEYKVHFQGWSSSWDRAFKADYLLKDNVENRQLQRELAEAAQLQIGGYSYKDTKTPTAPVSKKKRSGRAAASEHGGEKHETDPLEIAPTRSRQSQHHQAQQHELPRSQRSTSGGSRSRDNSGGRKSQATAHGNVTMKGKRDAEGLDASMESINHVEQEDRVMLRISERLREYMEYDYNMVVKFGKQHALPARMPIVSILESFVKQRAVELALSIKQESQRARNTKGRCVHRQREFERVMSIVCLIKEVVDGLRIYFEFLLEDQLLYKEEKPYTYAYLTEENMRNCSDILNKSFDYINPNCDTDLIGLDGALGEVGVGDVSTTNGDGLADSVLAQIDYEKQLQKCLEYIDKHSGKNNNTSAYKNNTYFAAYNLPIEMRDFLFETFNWRLLNDKSPPEKSMVFGAPHLARLLVKLPEYLNVSPISNESLGELLPHLDTFINYLENHKEWFDKENYMHDTPHQEQLQMELLESLDQNHESSAIASN